VSVNAIGGSSADRLVERLRNGDASALRGLMECFGSRVYRIAHRITRNEADAEEVVQDVFFNLCRGIGRFEGRSALGTWIHRVATNAAVTKRRRDRDGARESRGDGQDYALRTSSWSPYIGTPDEELLRQELRTTLERAIDALPDGHRAALHLRHVQGLSNGQAARALGESIGSLKSRLHRARVMLRRQLGSYYGAEAARPATGSGARRVRGRGTRNGGGGGEKNRAPSPAWAAAR
jgi:RNA polymerase sigma-70 factor (ECF subfamily)